MKQKIINMIKKINSDVIFEENSDLFAKGIIDSFAVVTLVSEIEEKFNIELEAEEIIPENFQTINAIMALVEKNSRNN